MEERLNRERGYGDSGDRTVEEGATGSPYDTDRGDPSIDEGTPRRITDVNTYNVEIEGSGEVKTESSGGAPVPAGGPERYDNWDQAGSYYRSRWQQRYGTAGRRWEDYEPAYRFGWERARMPLYRGRSWSDVEPELRTTWESGHNLSPWDRVVDAIKDTWENITGRPDRPDADRAA